MKTRTASAPSLLPHSWLWTLNLPTTRGHSSGRAAPTPPLQLASSPPTGMFPWLRQAPRPWLFTEECTPLSPTRAPPTRSLGSLPFGSVSTLGGGSTWCSCSVTTRWMIGHVTLPWRVCSQSWRASTLPSLTESSKRTSQSTTPRSSLTFATTAVVSRQTPKCGLLVNSQFLFAALKDCKIMRCFSSSQLDAFPGPLSSYWLKPDLGGHLSWIIGCKPPTVVGCSAVVCQHSKLSEDVTQIQTKLLQSMDWGLTYSRLQTISLHWSHWWHQCVMAGKAHAELISISSIECSSKLVTAEVDGKHGVRWDATKIPKWNWGVVVGVNGFFITHLRSRLVFCSFQPQLLVNWWSILLLLLPALLFSLCLRLFVRVLAQV